MLALVFPSYYDAGVDPVTKYGGGLVYVLLTGMTLTSFDRSAAMIGRRAWTILHTLGAWSLWLVFTFNYTSAAIAIDARYAPLSLLLFAAFTLRVWLRFARRSGATAQASPG